MHCSPLGDPNAIDAITPYLRHFICVDTNAIDTARHTELEQQVMTQHRWFTADELSDWHEAVFPPNLAKIAGLDQAR